MVKNIIRGFVLLRVLRFFFHLLYTILCLSSYVIECDSVFQPLSGNSVCKQLNYIHSSFVSMVMPLLLHFPSFFYLFFWAKQYSVMVCKESISQCLLLYLLTNNAQFCITYDMCNNIESVSAAEISRRFEKYFDSENSIDSGSFIFRVHICWLLFRIRFFFFHFKIFPLFCIEWNRFVFVHRIFATLFIIVEYIFICFHISEVLVVDMPKAERIDRICIEEGYLHI